MSADARAMRVWLCLFVLIVALLGIGCVISSDLSLNGSTLVSTSGDGTVILWRITR